MAKENAEEDAKAAAEAEAKAAAEADDGLVALAKDGDIIRAHPVQVPLWLSQGWTVVAD